MSHQRAVYDCPHRTCAVVKYADPHTPAPSCTGTYREWNYGRQAGGQWHAPTTMVLSRVEDDTDRRVA